MIDLYESMGQGRDWDRWICQSDTSPTVLCGPVPGTRRFKQAGRFYQSQNNLKMCHCVTEQKQNNNCLMTQFDCGLVLIARNEYVFIICTVLHCYGCPHLAALIVCNNFPRMLVSVFWCFLF